jgi:CheY-like chemotaxis protein
MRSLLVAALRRDGHRVAEAKDGEEALDWLGLCLFDGSLERIPSLIVSDIRLPNFTGIELLEGLLCAREPIPTILITGFPDARIRADAEELGAECVIEKPFDLDELRAAVQTALHPDEAAPYRSA